MGTNCKIIIGYVDHWGNWNSTKAYYRHYDGYDTAIVPLLQEFTSAEKGVDIDAMNEVAEYDSHEFEELENTWDYGTTNYMYYIDQSNRGKICCTVLAEDMDYYRKYCVSNMKVVRELVL